MTALAMGILAALLLKSDDFRRPILRHSWMINLMPVAIIAVALLMIADLNQPLWVILLTHLVAFFIAAMLCELATAAAILQSRPRGNA